MATAARTPPQPDHSRALPARRTDSDSLPRKRRPPPARPEARAGAAPLRSRPRLHKLVCLRPARRSRLRYLGGRTHLRLRPAGAPASPGRRARSPAVPEAQCPWRLHAPGRPAASGPTRPGRRTPPQGSPGLRASGLSRGGGASGRGAVRSGRPAAGGRASAGLCTCSLARPEDSGRPPPGPRGARAAARPPARRPREGSRLAERGPTPCPGPPAQPTACSHTPPSKDAATHSLSHTHAHAQPH